LASPAAVHLMEEMPPKGLATKFPYVTIDCGFDAFHIRAALGLGDHPFWRDPSGRSLNQLERNSKQAFRVEVGIMAVAVEAKPGSIHSHLDATGACLRQRCLHVVDQDSQVMGAEAVSCDELLIYAGAADGLDQLDPSGASVCETDAHDIVSGLPAICHVFHHWPPVGVEVPWSDGVMLSVLVD
jgi:hypothetical protein